MDAEPIPGATRLPVQSDTDADSPRQLWQLPAFLAGVLAIIVVWFARPYLHHLRPPSIDAELSALRQSLDSVHPDLDQAGQLAKAIESQLDQFPASAGEANYLIGSYYLRSAESRPANETAPLLKRAREHLEEAEHFKLSERDSTQLRFALAKVWFMIGGQPERVIPYLWRCLNERVEDPGESYRMLSQAYLQLPTPDLRAALHATREQLALSTVEDDRLAEARLLQGDLLFRLHQSEEARKVLARVTSSSPRPIYERARWLRAESCQKDRVWAEAAPLWEEILRQGKAPDRGRTWYELGVCYNGMDRPVDAARAWEQALGSGGEAAQAAALALGEVWSRDKLSAAIADSGRGLSFALRDAAAGDKASASVLGFFARALDGVKKPEEFKNSLVSLPEARQVVERVFARFCERKDFASALELARRYAAIGPPGVSEIQFARAAEAWALDLKDRAEKASAAERRPLQEEANRRFREAASAFEALASTFPAERDKWLSRSAQRFEDGEDYLHALQVYRHLLVGDTPNEKRGELWLRIAQLYGKLKNDGAAYRAYLKCIEFPGPFAFRARFEVARREIDQGHAANAEAMLKQNLDLMADMPEDPAYLPTLLALAALSARAGNHRLAAVRLQEALDRFPNAAGTLDAHKQLADCCRALAAREDENLRSGIYPSDEGQAHYREQRRLWLQKAQAQYQKVADKLETRQRPLSDTEERLYRESAFAAADCAFEIGEYPGAARRYEELAVRYRGQPESLSALKQITRCYWVQQNPAIPKEGEAHWKKARETIERVRKSLADLPDSAFTGAAESGSRQEWDAWVDWAAKQ